MSTDRAQPARGPGAATSDGPLHRVAVDGVRLAYRESGRGRPLVCVHGNFASSRWFTEQLRSPPEGWRVLAPDLPNFGASDPLPGPIGIEAYADALAGFITAVGLERPAVLGHSLGGAVVQMLAARSPQIPAGLVLVAPAPPAGLKTPEERYPLLELLRDNRELMARALAPTMPTRRPAYFDELVEDALAMHPAALSGNARALERYDLTGELRQVTCPVLVVCGEHDTLVDEAMARATAAAFPRARLELLDGLGHSPQLEDPARFHGLLESFLEGLP